MINSFFVMSVSDQANKKSPAPTTEIVRDETTRGTTPVDGITRPLYHY